MGVGVSGGADSMALLHILCALKVDVVALHADHMLRGEASTADAQFVADYCTAHHIPLHTARLDVPACALPGEGAEQAARRLRYAFFAGCTQALGLARVAVAHHADDNAETILLHLLRGSGAGGALGMRPFRPPNIIRPLLHISRAELTDYVQTENIPFVTDQTNLCTNYTRNYLRHEICPRLVRVNPQYRAALLRYADVQQQEDDFVAHAADEAFAMAAVCESGTASLRIDLLQSLHPALLRRVLRGAAAHVCGLTDIEQRHIDALAALCIRRTGAQYEVASKFFARVSYNTLILSAFPYRIERSGFFGLHLDGCTQLWPGERMLCEPAPPPERFGQPGDPVQYLDADALEGAVVRGRQPGDRFSPLGMRGSMPLKKWLIDHKVDRAARDALVLVAQGENVLWIVGHAVSEQAKIAECTRNVVRICYEKEQ